MFKIRPSVLFTAILVGGLAGCAHCRSDAPIAARPTVSGFAPCDCGPANGLPRRLSPSPAPGFPGPTPDGRQPRLENRPPPDDFRGYPPEDPKWRPSPESNLKPHNPPIIGDPRDPRATLKPPVIGEQERPSDPRGDGNLLPIDIPQFAFARKQVTSGQKPFIDGLDWLRDKGYRTALHVRPPKEDDAAAKRQFTAKGIRYLSLEVSPETLNRDVLDEFNRLVTEPGNLPLFVYDRDSSLLGGLWYLHFRLHEGWSHDKAAMKAGELGLNIEADGGSHKEMWLAVQRYLQMDKPATRPSNRVHTAVWTRQR